MKFVKAAASSQNVHSPQQDEDFQQKSISAQNFQPAWFKKYPLKQYHDSSSAGTAAPNLHQPEGDSLQFL